MKIPRAWLVVPLLAFVGLLLGLSNSGPPRAAPRPPALMDDDQPETPPGFSEEDYRRHLQELRGRLPGEGFTIVVEKPFVVVGDESPERVRGHAERIVKWAAGMLKGSYFERDPKHILDVWLFKDKDSYERNAEKLFGSRPDTKFGYYSSFHRALVMNIDTGGGTLVHEMVHAFMDGNFPDCPPWFNEGLGSLYEQCREYDGRIEGLLNWRLPILQKAIRAGRLPTIRTLTAMSATTFYGPGRGDHYAMARYLLYRLEREGMLRDYYRTFHENRKTDPTGYETLVATLGEDDMAAWQKAWEKWVLGLRR